MYWLLEVLRARDPAGDVADASGQGPGPDRPPDADLGQVRPEPAVESRAPIPGMAWQAAQPWMPLARMERRCLTTIAILPRLRACLSPESFAGWFEQVVHGDARTWQEAAKRDWARNRLS
jgi:hypothetical protein